MSLSRANGNCWTCRKAPCGPGSVVVAEVPPRRVVGTLTSGEPKEVIVWGKARAARGKLVCRSWDGSREFHRILADRRSSRGFTGAMKSIVLAVLRQAHIRSLGSTDPAENLRPIFTLAIQCTGGGAGDHRWRALAGPWAVAAKVFTAAAQASQPQQLLICCSLHYK